ncbi:outer membrane adhesin like protein [Amphritea japonica ATCC BAA-1530]|uniref:Outer membrane adhesin like protein n=4 Tax=Amphritea TaxID=515417 RepID=A0A7R6PLT6_9GAMM|nr:outer membrane adhesin like protein [Amphritea japonica ATCC BAA-1530]
MLVDNSLSSLLLEKAEPRILLSADPVSAALAIATDLSDESSTDTQYHFDELLPYLSSTVDPQLPSSPSFDNMMTEPSDSGLNSVSVVREVIFVDTQVPDYLKLINQLEIKDGSSIIVSLNSSENGLDNIGRVLQSYQNIDAIHLISHGSDGTLQLGDTTLNNESLDTYSEKLLSWRDFLNEDADILIYGCNLAASENGVSFVNQLASLTGADIAASDDLTGSNRLGGDWELEYKSGQVEAALVISESTQKSWESVLNLMLSTDGNPNSGAAGLASWNAAAVLDFTPTPSGYGSDTNGSLSFLFGFTGGVNIDALHYVTADISVGTGTPIDLLAGDLLMSLDSDETLSLNNTLDVKAEDIFIFRPDTPGDYSAGTFSLLFTNPTAKDITGFTLVEDATVVGDTTLQKGTFLFSVTGAGADDFGINSFQPDDLSLSPSNGISAQLIDGREEIVAGKDLFQNKIIGIELVENDYSTGGETLSAGTILLTFDGDKGVYADNTLIAERQDIYALNVSETTLVNGATAATVTMFFDGEDILLDENKESLNAITLTDPQSAANSLPTGGVSIDGVATEDNLLAVNLSTLADADGLGAYSYQWQRDGLTITGATTGNYTLGDADVGALISLVVSYTDGAGNLEVVNSGSVGPVANINDDPTVDNAIADQTATENSLFIFTFAADAFGDVDAGDTLSYTAQLVGGGALPSWLVFVPSARTFGGFPLNGDVGTLSIEVIADDGNGGTPAVDSFDLVVGNINNDPTVDNAITNQSATEDSLFSFTFAANTFGDVDVGDTLTYRAQLAGGGTLPTWLSFNPLTRTFEGTPLNGDVGTLSIELIADDGNGGTAAIESFDIVVANTNDDPTVDNAITNQSATEDSLFSFTFAANTFGDVDVGDTLSYSAQLAGGGALPSWLSFNPVTRTFEGIPLNADVGTLSIELIADDSNGGTAAIESFDIVVTNTNDDPTVDNAITNQSATEDSLFSFTFAANTFGDVDVGDTLSYSAQLAGGGALPTWLSFNPVTRTFEGTPLNGDVGTLSIELIADDGNGGTAAIESFDIVVANTNDDPTVDNAINNQSATEDSLFSFTFAANTFGDVDVGDTLSYSAQLAGGGALPTWLSFNPVIRTFEGTPLNADVGTLSIELIADDSNGGTAAIENFDIVVTNTNDDPTVDNVITDQSATEDSLFSFTFAANTFGDVDVGDTLSYSAQLAGGGVLPTWLSFNPVTRTFEGTPLNADVGTLSIELIADDSNGGTAAIESFDIVVANTNDDPTVDNAITDQSATEDSLFSYTFAANSFGDVDVGDTLSYSAQLAGGGVLPTWLSFNPVTRTFEGIPLNADVGTLSIELIADDSNGGTAAIESFDIVVANTNDDPTVDNAITDQSATEDSLFSFTFAANTFGDVDVGDTLSYSAQLAGGGVLPTWLSFNPVTRTFEGIPLNADVGTLSIELIADDSNGGTAAIESFDIVVANTNDDPTVDNAITDQSATEDSLFSFTFAANTFGDVDVGDTLSYSAQLAGGGALPSWLSFNPVTRTFEGIPLNADVGTLSIELIADDSNGGTPAVESFNLEVVPNEAPVGDVSITGSPVIGQVLTLDNTITDADGLGPFSYQWYRDGLPIPGATAAEYTSTALDSGADINVIVSYTDALGNDEQVVSALVSIAVPVEDIILVEPVENEPDDPDDEESSVLAVSADADEPAIASEVVSVTPEAVTVQFHSPKLISSLVDQAYELPSTLNEAIKHQVSVSQLQPILSLLAEPIQLQSLGGFIDGLENLEKGADEQVALETALIGGSIAISSGLSVGYVIWLARSGVLLSSVLTALPAWRFIDPLPILATLSSDDDSKKKDMADNESLDDIVDHEKEPAESDDEDDLDDSDNTGKDKT